MIEINDDIWKYHNSVHYIVIPTNGDRNKKGECVMGRGLALQAKLKFPELPNRIGTVLKMHGNIVHLNITHNFIIFPVKHHWHQPADLKLIEESCKRLAELLTKMDWKSPIYMPKVGCGNGGLKWKQVEPILEKYLSTFNIYIVDKK